jgi:AraC family transcriptional regulator
MIRLSQGTYFGSLEATHSVAGLTIRENTYAGDERIPMHVHAHPFVCLVISGGFTERSGRMSSECGVGSVIWHPEGEPHEDRFAAEGGRCVGIEFDRSWLTRLEKSEVLPDVRTVARGGAPSWLAARISRELSHPDTLAPFAVEGLACALMAELARSAYTPPSKRPIWIDRAITQLREEFRTPPTISTLAANAGVHPSHFVRVFRHHMGCTVGDFVRRLRIDWTCGQLRRESGPSLSNLALAAGFADQAHFSRTFKRITGTTPRHYRLQCGRETTRSRAP